VSLPLNAISADGPHVLEDDHAERVAVCVLGRFMSADNEEHRCFTKSISCSMLGVEAEAKPRLNEHVTFYLRGLGRIEGWVSRLTPNGFAVVMTLTQAQRLKIDAKLRALPK
jgi:hypothetical protein